MRCILQLGPMPREAAEEFGVCGTFGRISGKHDQVNRWQRSTTDPEAFANHALQAVSVHRMAYFLSGNGKTKPRHVLGIWPVKHGKKPVC